MALSQHGASSCGPIDVLGPFQTLASDLVRIVAPAVEAITGNVDNVDIVVTPTPNTPKSTAASAAAASTGSRYPEKSRAQTWVLRDAHSPYCLQRCASGAGQVEIHHVAEYKKADDKVGTFGSIKLVCPPCRQSGFVTLGKPASATRMTAMTAESSPAVRRSLPNSSKENRCEYPDLESLTDANKINECSDMPWETTVKKMFEEGRLPLRLTTHIKVEDHTAETVPAAVAAASHPPRGEEAETEDEQHSGEERSAEPTTSTPPTWELLQPATLPPDDSGCEGMIRDESETTDGEDDTDPGWGCGEHGPVSPHPGPDEQETCSYLSLAAVTEAAADYPRPIPGDLTKACEQLCDTNIRPLPRLRYKGWTSSHRCKCATCPENKAKGSPLRWIDPLCKAVCQRNWEGDVPLLFYNTTPPGLKRLGYISWMEGECLACDENGAGGGAHRLRVKGIRSHIMVFPWETDHWGRGRREEGDPGFGRVEAGGGATEEQARREIGARNSEEAAAGTAAESACSGMIVRLPRAKTQRSMSENHIHHLFRHHNQFLSYSITWKEAASRVRSEPTDTGLFFDMAKACNSRVDECMTNRADLPALVLQCLRQEFGGGRDSPVTLNFDLHEQRPPPPVEWAYDESV